MDLICGVDTRHVSSKYNWQKGTLSASGSGMYAKKELLYDSDTVCSLCSEHSDSSKSFWLYRLWLGLFAKHTTTSA